jgi:hypothetical protein
MIKNVFETGGKLITYFVDTVGILSQVDRDIRIQGVVEKLSAGVVDAGDQQCQTRSDSAHLKLSHYQKINL